MTDRDRITLKLLNDLTTIQSSSCGLGTLGGESQRLTFHYPLTDPTIKRMNLFPARPCLFIAQSNHRIDPGGAPGREPAGEQGHRQQDHR